MYHNVGRLAGAGVAGGGGAENMITGGEEEKAKPYIVRRWAILRRMLQNSPEVTTSTTAVWTAMDTISPPPICCFAFFLEFRQLLTKYLALFLCTMSKSVPPATKRAMTTTYVCMTVGGTDAESSANGLLVNIARRSLHDPSFERHDSRQNED